MLFFILGASDPEMAWIERQLINSQLPFAYAGRNLWDRADPRVMGHNANRGQFLIFNDSFPTERPSQLVFVECRFNHPIIWDYGLVPREGGTGIPHLIVDHHRPGDPGYGKRPELYWEASSIGQVMKIIDPDSPPDELDRIVAAADHCLLAAYRGDCSGVDPEELSLWRIQQRALHRRCSIERVISDIESAATSLLTSSKIEIGGKEVSDLRGERITELKEAACRLGIPYVTSTLPNKRGRCKVVLGGACPTITTAFIKGESIASDLVHRYGDPQRGFAGGTERSSHR